MNRKILDMLYDYLAEATLSLTALEKKSAYAVDNCNLEVDTAKKEMLQNRILMLNRILNTYIATEKQH